MAYSFYAGKTFNFAGMLELTGWPADAQPNYSNWQITAQLYNQAGDTLIADIPVTNNTFTALPSTNGLYTIDVSGSETAKCVGADSKLSHRAD